MRTDLSASGAGGAVQSLLAAILAPTPHPRIRLASPPRRPNRRMPPQLNPHSPAPLPHQRPSFCTIKPALNVVDRTKRFFTIEDDGLVQDWIAKTLYANFPYARYLLPKFVAKLIAAYECGDVQQAIMLTNAGSDTEWFHAALKACSSVCFVNGRIPFLTPQGPTYAPVWPSVFFYFGNNLERFESVFCKVGSCMRVTSQ
jgi:hypothetical protein